MGEDLAELFWGDAGAYPEGLVGGKGCDVEKRYPPNGRLVWGGDYAPPRKK